MSTTCIPPARHIRTDDIPEEYRDIVDAIGMEAFVHLTLLCGGMSELIAKNGGIAWIIQKLRKVMKGNKSAQVGIAAMVSLCDCATANNTVAIIVAGDMARDVSHEYKVDPRRTASLLLSLIHI